MAEIDNRAFESMKESAPEKNFTGGAIEYSEYEMDMTPMQQRLFKKETADLFRNLYNADPLVDQKKLPYRAWLQALSTERIKGLTEEYEDREAPRSPETIIANDLMKQASKHWGGAEGFESIRKMSLERGEGLPGDPDYKY